MFIFKRKRQFSRNSQLSWGYDRAQRTRAFCHHGSFTRDAKKEATRDGAPPIELIDGMQLVTLLKDLRIGINVKERTVEDVTVDNTWFDEFNATNS